MLSTIGRAAVRRVVAGGAASTNRAFPSIWHLQHVGIYYDSKSSLKFHLSQGRSYATATKAAPKPKTTKPKTTKPKKAVAKKVVKKPAKKVARKKAVKKPKPKPRKPAKKILTEEQARKVAVKDLKAKALSPPKQKPISAWTVLAAEYAKEHASSMPSTGWKDASAKYKGLGPAELEVNRSILSSYFTSLTIVQSYNHIANQNKAANEVALKQWIESHTPEQIRLANNARRQLKTKDPRHYWPQIQDHRQPKHPRAALNFFLKERFASGDLKGISMSENGRLVAKEFAALSPSERKAGDTSVSSGNTVLMFYRPTTT
jgi:hypothetical protein